MITEDQDIMGVNSSRTNNGSTKFIRVLPSISATFTNPKAVTLKAEFSKEISVLATPKDDPVYIELLTKYKGAILYDNETRASQKLFRVVAIQLVQSYTAGRFSCWEASCEPIFRDAASGNFIVPHDLMVEGSSVIQTNALLGYALAEYQNGSDGDPTYLPWVQNYMDYFRNVIEPRYNTKVVRDSPSCHPKSRSAARCTPKAKAKDLSSSTPRASTSSSSRIRSRS
jgi:hypothetical protein